MLGKGSATVGDISHECDQHRPGPWYSWHWGHHEKLAPVTARTKSTWCPMLDSTRIGWHRVTVTSPATTSRHWMLVSCNGGGWREERRGREGSWRPHQAHRASLQALVGLGTDPCLRLSAAATGQGGLKAEWGCGWAWLPGAQSLLRLHPLTIVSLMWPKWAAPESDPAIHLHMPSARPTLSPRQAQLRRGQPCLAPPRLT